MTALSYMRSGWQDGRMVDPRNPAAAVSTSSDGDARKRRHRLNFLNLMLEIAS